MEQGSTGFIVRRLRQLVQTDGLAEQPDSQLVQRFTMYCDDAAFTALVNRHGPMVLGVCRRVLADWHTVEDVFQATFLILARKAASIRKSDSLASWLYGVAYRLAIRVRVRTARRQQREQWTPQRSVAGPVEEACERENEAILDEELSRLPECYRAALVLCYVEGKTRHEAARHVGLPLRTFQRRLEQGRKLLRVRLSRRGLNVAAGLAAAGLSPTLAGARVPVGLVDTAVHGALRGTASSTAAALARDFLHSMRLAALWKAATALVLIAGCAIAGIGLALQSPGIDAVAVLTDVDPPAALKSDMPVPVRTQPKQAAAPLQHAGPVTCVAIAPDGKTAASGSEEPDTTVRLWDAATGREIHRVDVQCAVIALAWSRDGKVAAGCDDRTIRIIEAKSGNALGNLRGHQDVVTGKEWFPPGTHRGVSSLVFADDDKTLISAGYDGTIRLWDVPGRKELQQFSIAENRIHRLALSRDGKTLAAGCEDMAGVAHHAVRLWDMTTGKPIRPDLPRFKGIYSNGPVLALAFTPDGKRLAVGGFDNEVIVWDVSTGKAAGSYRAGFLMVMHALAYSPKGDRLAAGCSDGRIHFWDAATAKPVRYVAAHGPSSARVAGVSAIAFAPDGRTLVSGGSDHRVRVWEVSTGTERSFDE
jgi:RNA polymerase sigma factor (sigma-70 family)